jgi:hypothetical protein
VQTFLNLNTDDKNILISNENSLAIKLLENKYKFSIIVGPKKSGKTILANKFLDINGANIIDNIPSNLNFKNNIFLDLNKLPFNEEPFFHFLQYFITNDIGLTIFTTSDPHQVDSKSLLIPDTLSRLKSFNIALIENPKDDLLFKLIEKFLKFKSISVSSDIIRGIMAYIGRTYIDAYDASETINYLLYQNNHNINLSLIRQHYEQL